MGRTTKLLAAFIAVVALGGVVAVGAQTQPQPVKLCIKTGSGVVAPKADGTCTKGFTLETLARQSDVAALIARLATAEGKVAALEEENLAQAEQLSELDQRLAALVPAFASEPVNCFIFNPPANCDVHIIASGLKPNSALSVEVRDDQSVVRSSTTLVVDADGSVDQTFDTPQGGSYTPVFGDYITASGTGLLGQPVQYDSRTP